MTAFSRNACYGIHSSQDDFVDALCVSLYVFKIQSIPRPLESSLLIIQLHTSAVSTKTLDPNKSD